MVKGQKINEKDTEYPQLSMSTYMATTTSR